MALTLTWNQIFLTLGMLITGSINTLSKKGQNDCRVPGVANESTANGTATVHEFNHPWFQTVIMFIGEMLCLIGLFVIRCRERAKWRKQKYESLLSSGDVPVQEQKRVCQLILAIPTICDLIGTSLAGIGLVYINASVWQMLRGSIIIFTGILSKFFLKRDLKWFHWLGMIITMLGLALVGLSSVFNDTNKHESSETVLGIIFILAGQVVSASQMIIEEVFLKKRCLHPLHVVGMEGTFGFFLMALVVLPVMYFIPGDDINGKYENSIDALYQIFNDPKLLVFSFMYLLSIAFYNFFGLAVTKSLTAVHRTLIDACRTMSVWGVSLFIYYVISTDFGEPFHKTWGILQIDGFLFLMLGTAIYNELLDPSYICFCRSFRTTSDGRHASIQAYDDYSEAASGESEPLLAS